IEPLRRVPTRTPNPPARSLCLPRLEPRSDSSPDFVPGEWGGDAWLRLPTLAWPRSRPWGLVRLELLCGILVEREKDWPRQRGQLPIFCALFVNTWKQ